MNTHTNTSMGSCWGAFGTRFGLLTPAAPTQCHRLLTARKCLSLILSPATLLYRRVIIRALPAPQACQALIFFPHLFQRSRETNFSPVPSEHILEA